MKNLEKQRIAITGASGWLGRELLELLLSEFGPQWVQRQVLAFASKPGKIELSDGTVISSDGLASLNECSNVDSLVHLAFLTRDKVSQMSSSEYVHHNLRITSMALEFIERNDLQWVATVSSGAVQKIGQKHLENSLTENPYGFLKRIEENLLKDACESSGARIAIGRLWAAGGMQMPVNKKYALSSFIESALKNKIIEVTSKHKVYRTYCDARQFMELLVCEADSKKFSCFDSGGEEIELFDLARLIAKKTGSKVSPRLIDSNEKPDLYSPGTNDFHELLRSHSIEPATIGEIALKTITGHKKVLDSVSRTAHLG
jgi:nucleoside-diphosphate-sugar epimerase